MRCCLSFSSSPFGRATGLVLSHHLCLCRGDHSYAEAYLTVVARGTESVVFSIDGSFTASVSIMGSDPKVRAGAVDVVRWVLFNQGASLPWCDNSVGGCQSKDKGESIPPLPCLQHIISMLVPYCGK